MSSESSRSNGKPEEDLILFEVPEALAEKDVFSTGQAAKIMKVSQQTVIRVFDSGMLKGWVIPGSTFRRIPRKNLEEFIRKEMGGKMMNAPRKDEVRLTTEPATNGALHCSSTFELGMLLQNSNGRLRRIVVDRSILEHGTIDGLREQIQQQCNRLQLPIPEVVFAESTDATVQDRTNVS